MTEGRFSNRDVFPENEVMIQKSLVGIGVATIGAALFWFSRAPVAPADEVIKSFIDGFQQQRPQVHVEFVSDEAFQYTGKLISQNSVPVGFDKSEYRAAVENLFEYWRFEAFQIDDPIALPRGNTFSISFSGVVYRPTGKDLSHDEERFRLHGKWTIHLECIADGQCRIVQIDETVLPNEFRGAAVSLAFVLFHSSDLYDLKLSERTLGKSDGGNRVVKWYIATLPSSGRRAFWIKVTIDDAGDATVHNYELFDLVRHEVVNVEDFGGKIKVVENPIWNRQQ